MRGSAGFRRSIMPVVSIAVAALVSGCTPFFGTVPPRVGLAPSTGAHVHAPKPKVSAPSLARSRVGVSLYGSVLEWSPAKLAADLDLVQHVGATWVRLPLNWVSLETTRKGAINWTPADRVVNAARQRGLSIDAVVSYTPPWARGANRPPTDPPANPNDYADFVRALAQRYSPLGVHTWEIWNEPNVAAMWTPQPNATAYASLLRAAYSAIKRVDRNATVLSAGLSPALDAGDHSQIAPVTFVRKLYAAGAGHAFDAIAMHPSTYPYRSTYAAPWSAFQQSPSVYDVMRTNGDATKKIWATEIGWPTGTNVRAISETDQANYLLEGLRTWTSYSFTGPVFVYSLRDEGPDLADEYQNFGLVHTSGTAKPAYLALQRALMG
jgi:polysaccharide biosynthesis protein PslG